MNDPVIIERSEIDRIARNAVRFALQEMNKKTISPWITQHQASKLLGRGKLERAMARGLVKFHKRDPDKRLGRVMVWYDDVEKLLNNPEI